MKKLVVIYIILLGILITSVSSFALPFFKRQCKDPLAAVLKTMDCIEDERLLCTARGYSKDFKKFHNGVDTETELNIFFWLGVFIMLDIEMDYIEMSQVDDNTVYLQYVEKVTFRDGEVFYQHEDVLVKVNNCCKITLWEQTGDIEEQQAVEDKANEMISDLPFLDL